MKCTHRVWGEGKVLEAKDGIIRVKFREPVGEKRLAFPEAFVKEQLTTNDEKLIEKVREAQKAQKERIFKSIAVKEQTLEETIDIDESINYWRYRSGAIKPDNGDYRESLAYNWEKNRVQGVIASLLAEVGDLRNYDKVEDVQEKRIKVNRKNPGRVKNAWDIYKKMKENDIVFSVGRNEEVLGIGRIIGGYEYCDDDYPRFHKRAVKWLSCESKIFRHGMVEGHLMRFDLKNENSRKKLKQMLALYGDVLK